ncbi:hypothetical protein L1D31_11790 [Vibrio sp. Isolate23]|uniref:imm11 family protein n=1 Tax=Vibrio sp. Isolate23 TaxID=2908533 RepID=UPI001EFD7511|nr:DUF1629 domain-containing protein [Vibrio sp. Isolate23]MCG9683255.1 hypothetical protein [Vibrio sp. Isolate23]
MIKTEMLATFSENLLSNDIIAKPDDAREYLYSSNSYIPVSALSPIIWLAGDNDLDEIPDIIDKGDRMVSELIMKAIMSWDPYGIIFMPAALKSEDKKHSNRYIMAINNIIDVMNEEESRTYMKDNSDYGLPPELIVRELFICEGKYNLIPEHKKHIFRVKGSDDTIFFSAELVNHVWDIAEQNGAIGLVQEPFDFDEEAPVF